tara:strand:- start:381 stop:770 length:390 start_codon:yes stop_codon:yes gene_type:complete
MILKKIFSVGASKVIDSIGTAIDGISTSKEEKKILKNQLKEIVLDYENKASQEVTKRWESDSTSGWLPSNIRPLTLIFLTFVFVIISVFDGNLGGFTISPAYIPIYQTLLLCCYSAYFAGRSIEKIKKK